MIIFRTKSSKIRTKKIFFQEKLSNIEHFNIFTSYNFVGFVPWILVIDDNPKSYRI